MIGFNYLGKLGRLGNQMFQYAATKGISAHRGYDYCIPNHNEIFDDGSGNKLRIEIFNPFNLDVKCEQVKGKSVGERGFHFDELLFNECPDNTNLVGFFQSEKYFKHIESEIRKDFTFKDDIVDDCKEVVEELLNGNPIALHIRRTDYLINPNHYALDLEYYEEALSKFDSNREVVIFTDDPLWVSQQKLFETDRFLLGENIDSYHDLYLMTQCSDFIIANSTFSWWGAWLANTGKVIAPSKWFGPGNYDLDTKDLYPKHWEIL